MSPIPLDFIPLIDCWILRNSIFTLLFVLLFRLQLLNDDGVEVVCTAFDVIVVVTMAEHSTVCCD